MQHVTLNNGVQMPILGASTRSRRRRPSRPPTATRRPSAAPSRPAASRARTCSSPPGCGSGTPPRRTTPAPAGDLARQAGPGPHRPPPPRDGRLAQQAPPRRLTPPGTRPSATGHRGRPRSLATEPTGAAPAKVHRNAGPPSRSAFPHPGSTLGSIESLSYVSCHAGAVLDEGQRRPRFERRPETGPRHGHEHQPFRDSTHSKGR